MSFQVEIEHDPDGIDLIHVKDYNTQFTLVKSSDADSNEHVRQQCQKMLDGKPASFMLFNCNGENDIMLGNEFFTIARGGSPEPIANSTLRVPYMENREQIEKFVHFFATIGDDD